MPFSGDERACLRLMPVCIHSQNKTSKMAKQNILNVLLKTINDVQKQNKSNPNEVTADKSVFDLIKGKLKDLDQKNQQKQLQRGKQPKSILDMIKREIEGARRENKKDPNVATAPKSVFDSIIKKVEAPVQRQASSGLRKIVQDYNLPVERLPREVIQQVQQQYMVDRKNFDNQYAKALHDLIKKY